MRRYHLGRHASWALALGACRPPGPAPTVVVAVWDGPAEVLATSTETQHHPTAAVTGDGDGLVVFRRGTGTVGVPWHGAQGPELDLSRALRTDHPRVLAADDEYLVLSSVPAGPLLALSVAGDAVVGTRLGERGAAFPDLAFADGAGLAAWTTDAGIGLATFEGPFDGPVERAPVPKTAEQIGTVAVASREDGYQLVWDDGARTSGTLRTVRLDVDGAPAHDPVDVAPTGGIDSDGRADVAVGRSGWAMAWRSLGDAPDAHLRFWTPSDALRAEHRLGGVESAGRPQLAVAGDVLVVAWERGQPGTREVWLEPWDLATARPLGPAIRASAPGRSCMRPDVALEPGGRGLVVWECRTEGPGAAHRAVEARPFHLEDPLERPRPAGR